MMEIPRRAIELAEDGFGGRCIPRVGSWGDWVSYETRGVGTSYHDFVGFNVVGSPSPCVCDGSWGQGRKSNGENELAFFLWLME